MERSTGISCVLESNLCYLSIVDRESLTKVGLEEDKRMTIVSGKIWLPLYYKDLRDQDQRALA